MNDLREAARSILKVGDGRGFVVNGERDRLPSGGVRQRNCIRAYAGTFGFYGELVPIAEVERHAKAQMRGFDKINRVPPWVSQIMFVRSLSANVISRLRRTRGAHGNGSPRYPYRR